MSMFIGEHNHIIDPKGRLSIPTKFHPHLAETGAITRGLDGCLWLYPKKQWDTIAARLAALPISQKNSRAFARLMLAGAWEISLDAQGRINIPEYLRTYASLNKNVIIAGLYDRLEIWHEDAWHEYRQNTEASSEQIAEDMINLGI